jgi:hypothetical protein
MTRPVKPHRNVKTKGPPLIASTEAKAKLENAAIAAGLTIEQLADLVFESGIVPPKASDGITERYTLKDLGSRLWATMQAEPKDERAAWFAELVPSQKTAVIVALRDQGYRSEVIANDLSLEMADVVRIWNTYGSQLGAQVVGIRLDTIAGQLQLAAERAQQMAAEDGDHSAYWRIHKEFVAMLQSIGIVDQAIRKVQVTHKLDEEQKQQIEALAALRQKQGQRKLEIKVLTNNEQQGDELPEGLEKDYDDDDD